MQGAFPCCPARWHDQNCLNKFKRYFGTAVPKERVSLAAVSTFSDLARWMIAQSDKITVQGKGRFEMLHMEYLDHN